MADGPLRILVLEDEQDMLDFYRVWLPKLGYEICASAREADEALEAFDRTQPDLIIADVRLKDADGIEIAKATAQRRAVPVILVSGFVDEQLRAKALDDHVVAYLIKPVDEDDLKTAIPVAVGQFQRFLALKAETDLLRKSLRDRKVLERAKGIVMQRAGLNEAEAMHRLQKLALDKGLTLIEMAETVIATETLMKPPSKGKLPGGDPKFGGPGKEK